MKLKLEPNLSTIKYSKNGVLNKGIGQAKFIKSLLTPHLNLRESIQVPIKSAVNSKGFFKANKSNVLIQCAMKSFLYLAFKNLGLSGKNKALPIYKHILTKWKNKFFLFIFLHLINQDSSLSSSLMLKPNLN